MHGGVIRSYRRIKLSLVSRPVFLHISSRMTEGVQSGVRNQRLCPAHEKQGYSFRYSLALEKSSSLLSANWMSLITILKWENFKRRRRNRQMKPLFGSKPLKTRDSSKTHLTYSSQPTSLFYHQKLISALCQEQHFTFGTHWFSYYCLITHVCTHTHMLFHQAPFSLCFHII